MIVSTVKQYSFVIILFRAAAASEKLEWMQFLARPDAMYVAATSLKPDLANFLSTWCSD